MGIVTQGIPRDHVAALREFGGYAGFFETGTYLGATSAWASETFARVHTVEASAELFGKAKEVLGTRPNVVQHQGRSADVLREVLPALDGRWIFWLDAHWSAGNTFGEGEECPLLAELQLVLGAGEHSILVDDARLFFRPYGAPHDWREWPSIDQICGTIRDSARLPMSVTVVDDVIFALPRPVHERWMEHLWKLGSPERNAAPAPKRSFFGAMLGR